MINIAVCDDSLSTVSEIENMLIRFSISKEVKSIV